MATGDSPQSAFLPPITEETSQSPMDANTDTYLNATTDASPARHEDPLAFVSQRRPKRESSRRSGIFQRPSEASNPQEPVWYCSSYELPVPEKNRITKDDAHKLLLTFVGESNEDLHDQLVEYADQLPTADTPFDPMAAAIDHKFEEIRLAAAQAVAAHDEALAAHFADQEYHARTTAEFQQKLTAAEQENARLLHDVKGLLDKVADLSARTFTMSGGAPRLEPDFFSLSDKYTNSASPPAPPPVVDITVPKAYRTQVQALPLTAFEGATDVEAVYLYLKQLTNRVRLIRTFDDAQRIEYAISYMSGAAHRWAIDEWYPSRRNPTWLQFVADFKARWIPANAPVILTNKLERMELKGTEIDRINDAYRATLELLGIQDLSSVGEANQYYQMYMRKIKDPAITATITHISLTSGGLNLDTLLKYTATLMVRKLASTGSSKPSTPQSQPAGKDTNRQTNQRDRNTKKPAKVAIRAIEETSDGDDPPQEGLHAVDSRTTKPRSPPFNARRCFFCEDPGHIQAECPAKKELMTRLKSGNV
ncbi:hypothetical protein BJ508DRAFT_332579 [Ascobolus immersus RN42]|uniref:CCHC-type domain-containing protein n=1 Tax=Ascobolus immersus RN42 TaxID=1160509 RepID=A0A3N4HMD6_ASCIM|nr:hypothetical protein BJ508DRAFT_332579 [Ascobolus immersus RN42]